jgi:small-conductance mechanosensitive channel
MTQRLITALVATLLVLTALATQPVVAQTPPGTETAHTATDAGAIDYAAWETEAARAENLIDAATASTAFLENLRTALVGWRSRFLVAQDANAARIDTLQAQIDALGTMPADGAAEPPAIAERRATLMAQRAEAQVPRVTATEAFNRANGLIAEIDAILAARQARALFERDPAPVNPLNWPPVLSGLSDMAQALRGEVAQEIAQSRSRGDSPWDRVPFAAILSLAGLILVLRSRYFVGRWSDFLQMQGGTHHGRGVLAFAISLLQLLFPLTGLIIIGAAIGSLSLFGSFGLALVNAIISALVAVYAALWLGGRLFPVNPEFVAALGVSDGLRSPLRRAVLLLGLFLGLGEIAETIAAQDIVPVAARGVFVLPVYVGLAAAFLWLTRLLRQHRQSMLDAAEEGDGGFLVRMISILSVGVRAVAIFGTGLAAAGYLNLAEAVMTPTALTLGLIGVLLALQIPIRDGYSLLTGKTRQEASQALLPVLINLLLIVAAMPLLALIWGMRGDQIAEIISRFFEGFDLGGTRVTPTILIAVVLVFAIGMIATRILQGALRSTVLPRTRLDVGARNAVVSGIGYVGIALAAVIAITTAGIDLTALGVVLGALSVGIGFGLQNVVNNFVSGIILLIERPISEGDWIEVGPTMGIVKSISVRSTVIETFDKTDVIVPNADLISGTVTNWTRGNTIGRVILTVGVAYGTDTRRVQKILMEIAASHPDVTQFPAPGVDFMGFGADSLDFRVRVILRDIKLLGDVRTEMNHRIAERFVQEGIEIPFGQRDIWLRNPEALAPRPVGLDPAPSLSPQKEPDT